MALTSRRIQLISNGTMCLLEVCLLRETRGSSILSKRAAKLRKETGNKKSVVDVYRGAGWQMAYYFRRTAQKHAILLKVRAGVVRRVGQQS